MAYDEILFSVCLEGCQETGADEIQCHEMCKEAADNGLPEGWAD